MWSGGPIFQPDVLFPEWGLRARPASPSTAGVHFFTQGLVLAKSDMT
jgi:hypothetical protein